jgi:hypothetical protein
MNEEVRKQLLDSESALMAVADRLRSLSIGASRLFQTGLANELECLRMMVYQGRTGMRCAIDDLESARVKDADQASANVVNTALAMAQVALGTSEEVM